MISFRSVKVRLTLWYAFILTVLLSLFALLMVTELERALYRDTDRNLWNETETIERSMDNFLRGFWKAQNLPQASRAANLFSFPPALRLALAERVAKWIKDTGILTRSTLILRLMYLDQKPIISNLKGWEKEIKFPDYERDPLFMETGESFQTIHFHKKPVRLYYRLIREKGRPLFMIQAGTSIQEIKSTIRRLVFIILISIPGAVAAACLAGWLLARRFFHPIESMIREARQITTVAYLRGRLPRLNTGDELDRLAGTLNEMLDRLETSTRMIQDFSSDISHELKTPLAIIRGEIELALRRARSPEAMVETLRVIESEVNELIRLVDDLMLLVRSDAQQLRFDYKKVSLSEILRQVKQRFQERADQKGITLSVDLKDAADMEADEVYLKRLFSNLVDNAIKFTPQGGSVRIELSQQNGRIAIHIVDNGIGIEPEMQTKVFSRFYRTDQARSYEGAGLGLNIAKAICEAHKGIIRIESMPRQGTRVVVEFPSPPV